MWQIQQLDESTWALMNNGAEHSRHQRTEDAYAALQVELAAAAPLATDDQGRERISLRIFPLGVETSDERLIESAYWREGPLALMLQTTTDVGHFGAELAGVITETETRDNVVYATAVADDSDAGRRAVQILREHGRYGVSADLGSVGEIDFECREEDSDGWCLSGLLTMRDAEIMGATMTPFPAFADAWAELEGGNGEAMVAAATPAADELFGAPVVPPASWFERPEIDVAEDRRLVHVTPEGRVYGYGWLHGECHIGHPDVCVSPPLSRTGYAYFLTGHIETDEGPRVNVGQITLSGGHASLDLPMRLAIAHYDETRAGIADVTFGEDEHGGWFAGALRPTATREQVRILRACGVSGDWREVRDGLEMIALACVNVPGFPKVRAHVASGRLVALVAAGGRPVPAAVEPEGLREPAERMPLVAAGMSLARTTRRGVSDRRFSQVETRLEVLERKVAHLNPAIRDAIRDQVTV